MARISCQRLKHRQFHTDARQFPRLEDPRQFPVVIHHVYGIAYVEFFLLGIVLIHDHVVVVDQRPTLEVTKAAVQLTKFFEIEACNRIEARQRLDHRSHRKGDMWILHQQCRNFVAHRSRTKADRRRTRRPKPDISAYSARPLCRLIQRSVTHPDQRQDHRHLNGNGKHAEDRSDRPVA